MTEVSAAAAALRSTASPILGRGLLRSGFVRIRGAASTPSEEAAPAAVPRPDAGDMGDKTAGRTGDRT